MEAYVFGVLISLLLIPKIGIWKSFIILGIWGLLYAIFKKIQYSLRIRKKEPFYGEGRKGFFCGKIVSENILKSVHDDIDCVARSVTVQPMTGNFYPSVKNIYLSHKACIDVGGYSVPIESVEKITGNDIYALPTSIDSKEGEKYKIAKIRNIKKYMVIESILKNNEKVLVNGYVNEDGKICADEIIGLSDENVKKRFLVSRTLIQFSLLLISFGVFMIFVFA